MKISEDMGSRIHMYKYMNLMILLFLKELFKFLLNCFHDEYKILVDRSMEIVKTL